MKMRMNAASAIRDVVNVMLPEFTKNKVLHICLEVGCLCLPYAGKNVDDCTDEIKFNSFIHFIFFRPNNCMKVLMAETWSRFIKDSDVFELTSDHRSNWFFDGVDSELFLIHLRIIEDIEKKIKNLGKETPPCFRVEQPNCCRFQGIEIIKGIIEKNVDCENRKCKIVKSGMHSFFSKC